VQCIAVTVLVAGKIVGAAATFLDQVAALLHFTLISLGSSVLKGSMM
jgi:hypothetical protein